MPDRSPSERPVLDEAALLMPGLIHELRQPVMGLKAALHLLGRTVGTPLTQLDDWHLVGGELARLEEVLDTFRMLLHGVPLEALPFEPVPVVLRAVNLMLFRTRALGPRFRVVVPADSPVALGAPSAFLHALTNVLANALDAVADAGDGARVEVRLLAPPDAPGGLQVRVSDSGSGIPASLRARVFEPGFTTKQPGAGTGLGLYTARRLLAACGGALVLLGDAAPVRQPWAATEFSIELPLATGAPR